MECAALIDVCALAGYIAPDDVRLSTQLLVRIEAHLKTDAAGTMTCSSMSSSAADHAR